MMKIKHFWIILILLSGWLSAQSSEFQDLMNLLLEKNPDYQQSLSRYEQEKAFSTIDKSLSWFDVNFIYRQYDNDFIRNETRNVLEHSEVEEKDKRWILELEKQFFPKDFDAAADAINFRLNLLRFEQEVMLARCLSLADIINDMIDWFEADRMVNILQQRLEILYQQDLVLEELDQDNLMEPETMILLLEEIDDREDEMFDFMEICDLQHSKYGDILEDFYDNFQFFIQQNQQADTLGFSQKIAANQEEINREIRKISNQIKWNYYSAYLPEINLSLSYHWRETRQKWEIEKNGIPDSMQRDQDEEFPEGEIEFSLPFNIFSNTSGKRTLLKAYQREMNYRSLDLQQDWQEFESVRLNAFQEARLELKRKTRLYELYERELNLQKAKFQEEPSLLGSNPELKLNKKNIQFAEAELKMKLAEMKLYREIFLMNNLREEAE